MLEFVCTCRKLDISRTCTGTGDPLLLLHILSIFPGLRAIKMCSVSDVCIKSLKQEQFPLVERLNIADSCLTRDSLTDLLTSFPNLRILDYTFKDGIDDYTPRTLTDTDLQIIAAKVHIQFTFSQFLDHHFYFLKVNHHLK